MKAEYLITLVEQFCKQNNLDISNIYTKMSEIYQDTYGININYSKDKYCKNNNIGYIGMPEYLERIGTVERYLHILNGLKNCVREGWSY
ncbi:hypothetical protein [Clostridium beijerinckii]|uniref:hypothetical protein n=1 Tax=Clostridium beijerinckii TaxID=1520 RepID=UPI001570321A|nr:hypothetical protein [Clostridium beijerinckii]NRU52383.1 hypothetical protein [Clostridium beijerinckii]NRU52682.1 hypothetical protein [Clostridium beijerinckii]NYC68725.1 hypothetical protein [Clostridium beijerinckii]NYC91874.1 hypothetical protein [Clostridium beijerinckii]